jgi:alpha-L-rhamnosidase
MSLSKLSRIILTVAVITIVLAVCSTTTAANPTFKSAKPIWPATLETEKNLLVGFRVTFDKPKDNQVILKLTASTLYRVYLNGEFIGHGPARAAHGYYRVDQWDLGVY